MCWRRTRWSFNFGKHSLVVVIPAIHRIPETLGFFVSLHSAISVGTCTASLLSPNIRHPREYIHHPCNTRHSRESRNPVSKGSGVIYVQWIHCFRGNNLKIQVFYPANWEFVCQYTGYDHRQGSRKYR